MNDYEHEMLALQLILALAGNTHYEWEYTFTPWGAFIGISAELIY